MKRLASILFVVAMAPTALAQAIQPSIEVVPLNPSVGHARYFEVNDGEAFDKRTGKTWMRCNHGQTWDTTAQGCSGSPLFLTQESAFAEPKVSGGWRMPTADELLAVLRGACPYLNQPQLKPVVFPGLMNRFYVSSTKHARSGRPLAVNGCFAERPIDTSPEQQGLLLLVRDSAPRSTSQ